MALSRTRFPTTCPTASSAAFLSAARLMQYPFEKVNIPYQNTTLPGFIFRCSTDTSPRPTIIFNGGFDSVMKESWFAIAAPALQRGCNVLAFDGPGQGRTLRKQRLFFRHDWEHVITPVIDFAITCPGVDPDKLVLFGWSMGGYLAARAVTSEHRFAAVILDDDKLYLETSLRTSASDMSPKVHFALRIPHRAPLSNLAAVLKITPIVLSQLLSVR